MIKPEGFVLKDEIKNSKEMKVNSRVGQPLLQQDSFVNSGLSPFKKSQVESFNNIKSKL